MITGVSFNGRWVFGDPMLLEVEIDVPKLRADVLQYEVRCSSALVVRISKVRGRLCSGRLISPKANFLGIFILVLQFPQ